MKRLHLLAFSGCVLSSSFAFSQDIDKPVAQDLLGRLDFSVPQSPAFTVLGLSPEEVIVPTSYRTLALSLLNGLDAKGNAQTGIAIDTKPYLLSEGPSLTLDQYRNNTGQRMLTRLQLSFATSSGQESADKADRYALSLRFTPWDKGDPRMDFNPKNMNDEKTLEGCYRNALGFPDKDDSNEVDLESFDSTQLSADDKMLSDKARNCVNESEERNWNASSWDIGLAGFRVDVDNNRNKTGYAAWTSLALEVGTRGQFIAHARYQDNVLTPDGDSFSLIDGWRAGIRFRYGKPRGALMLEAVHIENEDENGVNTDGLQYLIGAEFRISTGFWLQLAVGDRTGDLNGNEDDVYFSGQLRWAFSESSLLE